jgi:NAD(P)-dependent dehydrogenase (short-subunit alcohol dehydrogenase family)
VARRFHRRDIGVVTTPVELFGLEGCVAVVTGGAQGLGRGICEALAVVGAHVAVLDIDADLAEDVARSLPTEAIAVGVDIRRRAELDDAVAEVTRRLGAARVWINNVGGMAGVTAGPTLELQEQDLERVLELNVTGTLLACQTALAALIAAGQGGAIVNVCSLQGMRAAPQLAAYGAAKAAVAHLTQTLALEYAEHGVRINAVAPSYVETPASAALVSPERREATVRAIPLGFVSEPTDVAGTVLAMASDLTRFVTGQVLIADGGLSLTTARPPRGRPGGG